MNIGDRVRLLREQKGMTQEELATKLGYKSKSSVTHIEKGRDIPRSMVVTLAKILDTTPAFLMGWEELSADPLSELMQKYDNIKPVKLKRFPMLGEIACGKPVFADEDREHYIMADMDIHADFCLTAKGDSMINAGILNGDIVIIQKQKTARNGEIVCALLEDSATIKTFYKEDGHIRLQPQNDAYSPIIVPGCEILGKVIGLIRMHI